MIRVDSKGGAAKRLQQRDLAQLTAAGIEHGNEILPDRLVREQLRNNAYLPCQHEQTAIRHFKDIVVTICRASPQQIRVFVDLDHPQPIEDGAEIAVGKEMNAPPVVLAAQVTRVAVRPRLLERIAPGVQYPPRHIHQVGFRSVARAVEIQPAVRGVRARIP